MAGRPRAAVDAALAVVARAAARVFFRQVEVFDGDRVPRDRPLVIVANHENNLVDPLLLAGFLGVRPRFLAKSTLWSHPVVAPLLLLSGALPVHRRQDAGADVSRNLDTFARCHAELARGAAVALFPEGTSHNRPHRLPLKTGAARIALEAEVRRGPLGLRILPVGLIYDDKARFRSRVIVQVGPPIDPAPEAATYRTAPGAAVRRLTARMAAALAEVTLNHASWDEARLVGRAAALLTAADPGRAPTLAEVWPVRQRVWRTYEELRRDDRPRADALARDLGRYEEALTARGLGAEDALLAGTPAAEPALSWRARAGLAVAAPFALAGTALNFVPYQAVDAVVRHTAHSPDQPATYKFVGALIVFPLSWAAQAALAWAVAGPPAAVAAAVAAPLTGYAALIWIERLRDWRARRRRRVLSGSAGMAALAEQRDRLRGTMRELLDAPHAPSS